MEYSSGSLRFKISLSKQEMEHEEPDNSSKDLPCKTSYSLFVVLNEIHRLCVKRDYRGIFAQPVTEDIAPNYFSFISKPMDLGTIYTKLSSRNYYSTARQYLDDLRLMCQNAMCYNPSDTIYYQKARKMLAFAEKQISPQGLRKLSAELLKNCRPLTDEEIDLSGSEVNTPQHHRRHHYGNCHRYTHETLQQGPSSAGSLVAPKLQGEVHEKVEDLERDVDASAERSVECPDDFGGPDSLTPSSSSPPRKRRLSNASISSVSVKIPRYANSPPLLIPEVDENFAGPTDSPLSICGRSDAITIDMETTEGDQVDYSLALSPASSSTISSSAQRCSHRPSRGIPSRRSSRSKKMAPNPRQSSVPKSRRNLGSSRPAMSPVSDRIYAEEAWTFTDSLTDRTPPEQVIAQAKQAAQMARAKFLERYGHPGRQTVVYLDTSETGKIYAKPCEGDNSKSNVEKWQEARKLVDYPLAMRQLLTPKAQLSGSSSGYHGLIEQMTPQQVATLHALSKIRYDPSDPIAMGIYGPLAIFEKEELAQLIDAYGGSNDAMVMESVLSLLKFVEPIGVEARRWAHLRLADATDGYHARMLVSFADPQSPYYTVNWMKRANLTIDASIVNEFKAKFAEEPTEKVAVSAQISTEDASAMSVSTSTNEYQVLKEESACDNAASGGQMSIAKLPSNTSTTSTTVKQMATVQSLQKPGLPNPVEATNTRAETAPTEQEEEEPYDLLTEALHAAVVAPSERNQQVLTTGSNSLTTTVNELAQISALTAAIGPIRPPAMALPANSIQPSAVADSAPNLLAEPNFGASISSETPFHKKEPIPVIEGTIEPQNVRLLASDEPLQPESLQISRPEVTPKMDVAEASSKMLGPSFMSVSDEMRPSSNTGVVEGSRLLSETNELQIDSGEPFLKDKEPIGMPWTKLDSTEDVRGFVEPSGAGIQVNIEGVAENLEKMHSFSIVVESHEEQSRKSTENLAESTSIQIKIEDLSLRSGTSMPPVNSEGIASRVPETPGTALDATEVVQEYFETSVAIIQPNIEEEVAKNYAKVSFNLEVAKSLKNQQKYPVGESPIQFNVEKPPKFAGMVGDEITDESLAIQQEPTIETAPLLSCVEDSSEAAISSKLDVNEIEPYFERPFVEGTTESPQLVVSQIDAEKSPSNAKICTTLGPKAQEGQHDSLAVTDPEIVQDSSIKMDMNAVEICSAPIAEASGSQPEPLKGSTVQHHIDQFEKSKEEISSVTDVEVNPNSNLRLSANVLPYSSISPNFVDEKPSYGSINECLTVADVETGYNPNVLVGDNDEPSGQSMQGSLPRVNVPDSNLEESADVLKDSSYYNNIPDAVPTEVPESSLVDDAESDPNVNLQGSASIAEDLSCSNMFPAEVNEKPVAKSSFAINVESNFGFNLQLLANVPDEQSKSTSDVSNIVPTYLDPQLPSGMVAGPSNGLDVDPTKKLNPTAIPQSQLEKAQVLVEIVPVEDSLEEPITNSPNELHRQPELVVDTSNARLFGVGSPGPPVEEASSSTELPSSNTLIQPIQTGSGTNSLLAIESSTFEVSNSPVPEETLPFEAFNPMQANLDEDTQSSYPHSNNADDTPSESGGRLVDYNNTDSSASESINR